MKSDSILWKQMKQIMRVGAFCLISAFIAGNVSAQTVINDNSDFTDAEVGEATGVANWAFVGADDDYATFEIVEDPDDSENKLLKVTITQVESVENPWDIQPLYLDVGFENGNTYSVEMRIMADPQGGGNPTFSLDPGANQIWGGSLPVNEWEMIEINHFVHAGDNQNVGIHLGSDNNANEDVFYVDYLRVLHHEEDDDDDEDDEIVDELLVWGFENLDNFGHWDNGGGVSTFAVSDDAVQGDHSIEWTYEVIAGEGWGGSSDIQLQPTNDQFPVLSDYEELRLSYKIVDPIDGGSANFNAVLFTQHDEGRIPWVIAVDLNLADDSGDWIEVVLPFEAFAVPAWETQTEDDYPNLDQIAEIQMQIALGSDDPTVAGKLLLDNLTAVKEVEDDNGDDVLPIPQPPHAIGDLLNYNGDFSSSEAGVVDGDTYAWTLSTTDQASMEIQEGAFNDDGRALRIDFGDWDGSGDDWNVEAVNEPIYPEEGDYIRASVWLRADGVDEENPGLANMYLGLPASGNWARYPSGSGATGGGGTMVDITSEWTEVVYYHEVSATDEESTMRLAVGLNHEENDNIVIYLANARVEKVLPIPQPPHAIGDLLNYNGDFSSSEAGVVDGDTYAWTLSTTDQASMEIQEGAFNDDGRALRIDFGDWDGSGDDWNVEAVNEPIYPEEGDYIRASVWLRADGVDEENPGLANMYLGLPASGNWARYPSGSGATGGGGTMADITSEWTEVVYYHEVSATDEENTMRLAVGLNHEENDNIVIYLANARVEKVEREPTSGGIDTELATEFDLRQNYPNPFNPVTTISYEVPQASHVRIDVFNALGQQVMTLVDGEQSQGLHTVNFDASNLSSGVYLYRMQAGSFVLTRKMMLVK
ncbi:T9SS type A sorting domain-containing protein [Balneolales bacterium ANBcel1]|nr:T9SS type A sorting domain-containing protein [Balneolales bacterium ANBcel1]